MLGLAAFNRRSNGRISASATVGPASAGRRCGGEDRRDSLHLRWKTHVEVPFVFDGERLKATRNRVIGKRFEGCLPSRIDGPVEFEIAAQPSQKGVSRFPLRNLHRKVQADQSHTLSHQRIQFLDVTIQQVPSRSVTEHDHGIGLLQIRDATFRPAAAINDRLHVRDVLLQITRQQHTARVMLVGTITMTWSASEKHDFLRRHRRCVRRCRRRGRKFLQADLSKLNFHRGAGVQLQTQQAGHAPLFLLVVDDIDRDMSIDGMHQAISLRNHTIVIPFFLLQRTDNRLFVSGRPHVFQSPVFVNDNLLAAVCQNASPFLLVQNASKLSRRVKVSLVPREDPRIDFAAAILNPGIAAHDAVLQPQLKVVDRAFAQIRKVFPVVGLSGVVCPVMAPSSTRQNFGLPSQPSKVCPSNSDSNPSSAATPWVATIPNRISVHRLRCRRNVIIKRLPRGTGWNGQGRCGGNTPELPVTTPGVSTSGPGTAIVEHSAGENNRIRWRGER